MGVGGGGWGWVGVGGRGWGWVGGGLWAGRWVHRLERRQLVGRLAGWGNIGR